MTRKFRNTGINTVEHYSVFGVRIYTPEQYLSPIDGLISDTISRYREAAIAEHETVPFTEKQRHVINKVAFPAVISTMNEILGTTDATNNLGNTHVRMMESDVLDEYRGESNRPIGGAYYTSRNQIVLNQEGRASDSPSDLANLAKVFIHEYFHFISNQYGTYRQSAFYSQRVGVRTIGEDIREKNKGKLTGNYFSAFNEAITEMLTIITRKQIANHPIFTQADGTQAPGYTTYAAYRQLTEKVLDDAINHGITTMTKDEVFKYVAKGYLNGELKPLIELVKATYPGLSMREFGLMTSVSDLPGANEFDSQPPGNGGGGRKVSEEYLNRLRNKINDKPNSAYKTDAPSGPKPPPPPSGPDYKPPSAAAIELKQEITEHRRSKIRYSQYIPGEDGMLYDRRGQVINRDENGNIVHYDQQWLIQALALTNAAAHKLQTGEMTVQQINSALDSWLFEAKHISELSDGFSEFYVLKHQILDGFKAGNNIDDTIREIQTRITALKAEYGTPSA